MQCLSVVRIRQSRHFSTARSVAWSVRIDLGQLGARRVDWTGRGWRMATAWPTLNAVVRSSQSSRQAPGPARARPGRSRQARARDVAATTQTGRQRTNDRAAASSTARYRLSLSRVNFTPFRRAWLCSSLWLQWMHAARPLTGVHAIPRLTAWRPAAALHTDWPTAHVCTALIEFSAGRLHRLSDSSLLPLTFT